MHCSSYFHCRCSCICQLLLNVAFVLMCKLATKIQLLLPSVAEGAWKIVSCHLLFSPHLLFYYRRRSERRLPVKLDPPCPQANNSVSPCETIRTRRSQVSYLDFGAAVYYPWCRQEVIPAQFCVRGLKITMKFAFRRNCEHGEEKKRKTASYCQCQNEQPCERIKRSRVPKQTQRCGYALFGSAPFIWRQVVNKM